VIQSVAVKHGVGVVDSNGTFGKRRIDPRFGRFARTGEVSAGISLTGSDGRRIDGAAHPPDHPLAPATDVSPPTSANRRMTNLAEPTDPR